MSSYVYIRDRSEPNLWTVGFYDPHGHWEPESDHSTREEAAARVHWLNGGNSESPLRPALERAADTFADMLKVNNLLHRENMAQVCEIALNDARAVLGRKE